MKIQGSHRLPGTGLSYDDDDVREGRLSLIVSGDTPSSMGSARVVESLDLVDGKVVEVPLEDAAAFVRSLPKASHAWVDATLSFDDPIPAAPRPTPPHRHRPRPRGVTGAEAAVGGPSPLERAPQRPAGAGDEILEIEPGGPDADRAVVNLQQAWDRGITGKGVTIAVIDSGLWDHPDLRGRIVGYKDMTGENPAMGDGVGHGTQVAGCAAGDGRQSQGRIKGAAPSAGVVGVRISTVSEAIAGLQWVIDNKDRMGIRVVNMSLGDTPTRSYKLDPWAQAAERAVEAGLVVVVAAGNEGSEEGTISTPGIDPRVITVGAIDTRKTLDTADDLVWASSSRGPTDPDRLPKPDVVAPGVRVLGPLAPGSRKDDPALPHVGRDYVALSGSSQATPLVAGVAALMLEANPGLTQADVKQILAQTARRYLPDPANAQGAGVVDAGAAVAEALRRKA